MKLQYGAVFIMLLSTFLLITVSVSANIANPEFNSAKCSKQEQEYWCMFNGYASTFYDNGVLHASDSNHADCQTRSLGKDFNSIECATMAACQALFNNKNYYSRAEFTLPATTGKTGQLSGVMRYCKIQNITGVADISFPPYAPSPRPLTSQTVPTYSPTDEPVVTSDTGKPRNYDRESNKFTLITDTWNIAALIGLSSAGAVYLLLLKKKLNTKDHKQHDRK